LLLLIKYFNTKFQNVNLTRNPFPTFIISELDMS